jgi:hypothetical protein
MDAPGSNPFAALLTLPALTAPLGEILGDPRCAPLLRTPRGRSVVTCMAWSSLSYTGSTA